MNSKNESNNLEKRWELVNFCEFDKYAIKSYCAIHDVNENKNLGDITKVNEKELDDFNMICGGSPCFVEGTLVLTELGYKPIEEIEIGDVVLTHNNAWKKVVHTMTNETNKLYRIKCMPSEDIHCTANHPFYVRKRNNLQDSKTGKRWRKFDKPLWVEAKDLTREYYVGTAINNKSEIPHWDGIVKSVNATDKTYIENTLSEKFLTKEFWYIIGRFIGDGWVKNNGGIIICANDSELHQITPYLEKLNWNYCISKERTINKIHIAFKEIGEYCLRFGKGAANKHLTDDILNLPVDLLKSFIEGFISADGTQDNNGLYRITSVSRSMIYELGQCIAKVYHRPFSIYFTQRAKTTVIEGRTVNQKDTYSIHYKLTTNTQDKAFYEDGYIWSPINDVLQEEYDGLVYNLEVEDDNSYVVQNIIVHNCQDFSVAGKQKGSVWTCKECGHEYNPLTVHWSKRDKCPNCNSEDIEKTRSSLLVEYLRVVRSNKPNFGIYENVKNIVGKQFKDTTFKLFTDELEEYGYNVYWKVLNAKNYGIPQNRERVYLLFIKKDLDNGKFKFPEPFDNGLRLKDLLENEVDEKFYISDEKVERFITNLNHKNSLLYDPCQVKREGKSREYSEYAPTLTSRDYKDPRLVNENAVKQIGNIVNTGNWDNPQRGRIYSSEGCSPALNCCGGGGLEPKIITGLDKSYNNPKFIEIANCITSREDRGISNRKSEGTAVIKIGNINPSGNGMNGVIYSESGLSPTLTTNKGEGNKVAIKQATKRGYIECEVGGVADLSYPDSKTRRGRVQENGNVSPTITATETGICKIESPIRIRKLTPKECFRLMGFADKDFDAAQKAGISNSQLYKQAGNSIVVDVLYYIYRELYIAMPYLFDNLKLSSFFSGIGAFETALDRLYEDINSGNFINPQTDFTLSVGMNPVLVGGIGEINFGKQFRQGNRVYDSDHIAMCLLAQPVGNAGGYSYLYMV